MKASDECDNFLYRNPFKGSKIKSECVEQVSFDFPRKFLNSCLLEPALGRLHGHVNWVPATYRGVLRFGPFVDKSVEKNTNGKPKQWETFSEDGDLDLHLADFPKSGERPIWRILTKDSQFKGSSYQDVLQLEFSSDELTHFFSEADWRNFQYPRSRNRRQEQVEELRTDFEGHMAIVNGLLDLDCVHDCHTELHPVYAMVLRKNDCLFQSDSACEPLTKMTDEWLLFVRNKGDEGSCSQDMHFLDRETFSFLLPAPSGVNIENARAVAILSANVPGLTWTWERRSELKLDEKGILVTINWGSDQTKSQDPQTVRVHGRVKIDWTGQQRFDNAGDPQPNLGGSHTDTCPVHNTKNNPRDSGFPVKDCTNGFERNHPDLGARLGRFGNFGISDYFRPVLGVVTERIAFQDASVYLVGGRAELFGTALGSVEVEYSHTLECCSVTSSIGNRYEVSAGHVMYGLRLGTNLASIQGLFLELKPGYLWRSSSPQNPAFPVFEHFHGGDTTLYGGFGYTYNGSKFFSIRFSVGLLYVPGTAEKVWRLAVAPQFRVRRNH